MPVLIADLTKEFHCARCGMVQPLSLAYVYAVALPAPFHVCNICNEELFTNYLKQNEPKTNNPT